MPEIADRDDAIAILGLCEEIAEIADGDDEPADKLALIKIKAEAQRLLAEAIRARN